MRKILTVLVLLSCIGMLLLNEISYRGNQAAFRDATYAQRSNVLVTNLLLGVVNAESSQRSFMLTGDKAFHNDFTAFMMDMEKQLASIESLLAEDPHPGADASNINTRRGMQTLSNLIREKNRLMRNTLELHLAGHEKAWISIAETPHKKRVISQIRAQGMQLISFNTLRIQRFEARMQESLTTTRITMGSAILLVIVLFLLLWRETYKHQDFEASVRQQLADERNKLDQMVQERTTSLRMLAANLQQVRENERTRLSRELHDELGALLTAAKLDVARLKSRIGQLPDSSELLGRIQHLTDTLNQGIALKRRIIEDLSPSALSNLGLVPALEIQAREYAEKSGLKVVTHFDYVTLNKDKALTVYRLIQEALTNVSKYAKASEVRITLTDEGSMARILVEDNGAGFDPNQQLPAGSHGLSGMSYRVETQGGSIKIDSAPGEGTRISAQLPQEERPA